LPRILLLLSTLEPSGYVPVLVKFLFPLLWAHLACAGFIDSSECMSGGGPGLSAKKPRLDNMTAVCVVGSGAGVLALVRALKASPKCSTVRCFSADPSPALSELASEVEVGDEASPAAILAFCKKAPTELAIVVPAASLAAGAVDALQDGGVKAIGARQAAAAVAGRDFARELMNKVRAL
jgi:hypothetical protein